MRPNTAAAFLLAGLALLRRNHRELSLYSIGVWLIGVITLMEYFSNSDFGIDQLLFRDAVPSVNPGRMSQLTALGLTLLGPALALMKSRSHDMRSLSRRLAGAAGALGTVALLGYSYDGQALYQVRPYSSLALPSALAFIIAGLGIECANPDEGLIAEISADSAGGAMLRWLLPAALLVPYLLGFTGWIAHKHLGWEMGFALALVIASVMLCLSVLVLYNARRMEREELALRESEERFRLVANTAPVMIWMSGIDKLCDYFNQRWLEFTGRTLAMELGNGWAEGVHPEDVKSCLDRYVEAFEGRRSFHLQYRLRRHDGEYRWIYDSGVPRFNQDGSFAGYIGSCVDITEQKLAEEALSEIGRRLIAAQEKERAWVARELHDDINQRIAHLAIELENWDQDLPESAAGSHDRIRTLHRRLSEIGVDIQALSYRLHSSKLDYLGLTVAAGSFCKELSQKQKVVIDFTHAGIPHNIPKEIALCLFRVLQEALQNAVKYSGARHFKVDVSGDARQIQLKVSDEGAGFDEGEARKRDGLGLISMRERVQMVNGDFSIKSRPGHGTTIVARVPLPAQAIPRSA